MSAARDNRGRFVSAEQARRNLADQVIEENVRAAVDILRRGIYRTVSGTHVEADHVHMARAFLLHAAHAVEPLLRAER